jgi:hypothetical protein
VVLVPGAEATGGKTPALTVSQLRQVFSRLLRDPAPTAAAIAVEVTRVLRRNEEGRCESTIWYVATRTYPPRRARPDTSEQVHFRSIPHRRTSIPQKRRAPMARGTFQYTDDTGKEQTLVDPPDDVCQSSSGHGVVVNGTDAAVHFYGLDGCEGRPMQGLPPGTDGPIGPFASFKFTKIP